MVKDSFEGKAWVASPEQGVIANADSISIKWVGVVAAKPLPPASYTAMAEPQFSLDSLGWPWIQQVAFAVVAE
jgi:hypothetical protein